MRWCGPFFFLLAANHLGIDGLSRGNQSIQIRKKRSPLLIETTVCYGELGCFSNGPPFYDPLRRPISVVPKPDTIISTRFLLHTRRNRNVPSILYPGDQRALFESNFDPRKISRVVVPGFLDNTIVTSWETVTKDTILNQEDSNVFIVNWSNSNFVFYSTAVANTRLVGAIIAQLITFLQKMTGARPENFHIIGHSLGSQIAGYAGERLHRLGRITGLDPAGPYYRFTPTEVRLDPSDALFVDVIHSNPAFTALQGFGTPEDVGNIDFFPAGGFPPGCELTAIRTILQDSPTEAVSNIAGCAHQRSHEFFQYSFNQNNCLFVGVTCTSWYDFTEGECDCGRNGENCDIMGFFASTFAKPSTSHNTKRRLFLHVGLERPYCVHQYQIIVHLNSQTSRLPGYNELYLYIEINGSLGVLRRKLQLKSEILKHIGNHSEFQRGILAVLIRNGTSTHSPALKQPKGSNVEGYTSIKHGTHLTSNCITFPYDSNNTCFQHFKMNSRRKRSIQKFLLFTDRHIGDARPIFASVQENEFGSSYIYESNISVERVRITYIFPLPRSLTSREFCVASTHWNNPYNNSTVSYTPCGQK